MCDYADQINSIRLCAENDDPVDECCFEDCNQHHGRRDNMCRQKIMMDAADAIEELLAAVPHWISVEERFPETGVVVLLQINCEKARPHTGFFTVDGMFMHDVIGDMSRSKWKVTHWMPLPKALKEVE